MTQEHILDMVEKHFPDVRETEARVRLNNAIDDFCERTLLFHKIVNITTDGGTDYSLDASIIRVDDVLYGTNVFTALARRPELYTGDGSEYVYFIEHDNIYLGKLGTNALNALDSGETVKVYCRAKADSFGQYVQLLDSSGDPVYDSNGDAVYVVADSLTEGPDIPSQFQEAIVWKVLADLYMGHRDLSVRERVYMHREFQDKYDRIVRKAANFSEHRKGQGFNITPHLY